MFILADQLAPPLPRSPLFFDVFDFSLEHTAMSQEAGCDTNGGGSTITSVTAGTSGKHEETPVVTEDSSFVYACRLCRRIFFTHEEIMPHSADSSSKGPKAFGRRGAPKQQSDQQNAGVCTSYFLNPDVSIWVAAESREAHCESGGTSVLPDTVYCPNNSCSAKIGTQSWVGSQCSCGVWVTPAFKIHGRAVDKLQSQ
ncbi:hypothetical protein, conserved [Trypanosoma brucei gambiense DAL972]|uniref:Uncharacterized protein n=1 Tax=Trypanosoma brucei gambiense (strain MHOM/CI/86/DAL972) TaxID=679716 RepID=D0A9M5_TRYB9|nr:hypothetical protein, conserved [Trypanosoma brucei gambiense DAL972]CBH18376.1 hypothetical protein, conserved [Trypanosoma brucei gambiense DAL972]|eukprot:XP_011780640.1 hypothetical protein, conserved [Trypanosoma brucei gambiense DAL972]